jgi:protein phosphatase
MKIKIRQPLCFSEIGRKDNQEDCIYPSAKSVSTKNHFFVLCDGMGGHENGEVASATVCESLGEFLENHQPEDGIMTPDMFKQALEYAYNELDKKDAGGLKKMGTTMTCLYLHKKGYLVAHIGDSRIYHIRPNTGIVYQSSDHSLVNDLLRAGELTEEEAINFPQKNVITRAMQPNLERRHKADIYSFSDIQKGDYFFLCCDGVLEQLTNDKLCEILSDKNSSDIQKLDAIKQVCDGKTKDNYTCYFIPIDDVVLEKDDDSHSHEDIILGVELTDINSPVDEKLPMDIKKKSNKLKWLILLVSLLVVGAGAGLGILYKFRFPTIWLQKVFRTLM